MDILYDLRLDIETEYRDVAITKPTEFYRVTVVGQTLESSDQDELEQMIIDAIKASNPEPRLVYGIHHSAGGIYIHKYYVYLVQNGEMIGHRVGGEPEFFGVVRGSDLTDEEVAEWQEVCDFYNRLGKFVMDLHYDLTKEMLDAFKELVKGYK